MAPDTIDEDGDLTLVVGPNSREFLVCSRALSRGSPVFKRMLNGGFKESRPASGPWIVTLPEDGDKAAEIMLYLMHASVHCVPDTLSLPDLHRVMVFSDKYDLTRYFRLWIEKWMPDRSILFDCPDYSIALGIAWELGDADMVLRLRNRMILNCEINDQGQLIGPDLEPVEKEAMPLNPATIYDNIKARRLLLLRAIFIRVQSVIRNLRTATTNKATLYCHLADSRPDGYVVRLYDKHEFCNPIPAVLKEIEEHVGSLESSVKTEHLAYLDKQRKKLEASESVSVRSLLGH
ncbi:hypothetical protein QBC44DRAFT_251133 [Cladorrhinum sp. PSN332]|nr:hypothetical protein QBC44DRAFT_251133 [Cladorrhinum sp. PSN332]